MLNLSSATLLSFFLSLSTIALARLDIQLCCYGNEVKSIFFNAHVFCQYRKWVDDRDIVVASVGAKQHGNLLFHSSHSN